MPCYKTIMQLCCKMLFSKNNGSTYRRYSTTPIKKLKYEKNRLILMDYFNLETKSCDDFIKSNIFLSKLHPDHISNSLQTCSEFSLNRDIVREHSWVLQSNHADLKNKLDILLKMNFTDINHGIPYIKHTPKRLVEVMNSIKNEEQLVPFKNRLYYLSQKLEVDPQFLAKYVGKRLFVYKILFDSLQKTLDAVLGIGVKAESIINDLWVLTYNHKTAEKRLKEFKDVGCERLMPWMVRCAETYRRSSIHNMERTRALLINNNDTQSYLAGKLNCTNETISELIKQIPSISTVNVCKVSDILDYLFSIGYTKEQIISVPRVLAHSLNTLKTRQNILKSLDKNHNNLNYLCKSKTNFNDFVSKLQKFNENSTLNQK